MKWDITKSLRDYEFTKRAEAGLNRMTNSRAFREMDSETIFRYLRDQAEVVPFGDYLKRYIYEKTGKTEPFREVPEGYYLSFLAESFAMNRAPHSFTSVTSRWSNILKRWLRSGSVKRSTVFLLGFGLNMTDQEVSEFLTKVLKEQDFRLGDPEEAVYFHCYHQGLPYAEAVALLEGGEDGEEGEKGEREEHDARFWASVVESLPVYLSNRTMLRDYLAYLRENPEGPGEILWTEFSRVYERAVSSARDYLQRENEETIEELVQEKSRAKEEEGYKESMGKGGSGPQLSGASWIENLLYSGVPRRGGKNLSTTSAFLLSDHLGKTRLSRQRISLLLRKRTGVERFDLITLLFLIHALNGQKRGKERLLAFTEEANEILGRCDFYELYPVNPYESFVMMCLLTEDPLCAFNDVWEMAYRVETE